MKRAVEDKEKKPLPLREWLFILIMAGLLFFLIAYAFISEAL